MVDDTTKKGLLEWLFGKGALEKAAKTGDSSIQKELNKGPKYEDKAGSDYVRKQIEATEKQKPFTPPNLPNAKPSNKPINEIITPIPNAKPSKASKDALQKLIKGNNDY